MMTTVGVLEVPCAGAGCRVTVAHIQADGTVELCHKKRKAGGIPLAPGVWVDCERCGTRTYPAIASTQPTGTRTW